MESTGESERQNRKTDRQGACSPRPDSPAERERISKLQSASDFRRRWYQETGKRMMHEPNLFPPNSLAVSTRLLAPEMYFYGIDIQPIGFPAGTGPQEIRNYGDIIFAFSRGSVRSCSMKSIFRILFQQVIRPGAISSIKSPQTADGFWSMFPRQPSRAAA